MDNKLKSLKEIKEALAYEGKIQQLKSDEKLLNYCFKNFVVAKLQPGDLTKAQRDKYTEYLIDLTRTYLKENPQVLSWEEFKRRPDTKKTHGMLHEFGVKGEIFPYDEENKSAEPRAKTSLTLPEFYELCQIQFRFSGSIGSFKKMIAKQYGSFAEYCILKGYDVNNTNWESDETALRVARKLGSIEEVRTRSKSLFKYLEERDLIDSAFEKRGAQTKAS